MAASSLLLFGPVSPRPSPTYLAQLRKSITERTDLRFLTVLIKELPNLWPTILRASPQLNSIPGGEQLDQLNHFLTSGTLPNADGLSNLVVAPLTVISQISEVLSQDRNPEDTMIPISENVQGFCLGFLAAAVFAISRDVVELRKFASAAVRLAVCIGAIVDLDEASHEDPADRRSSIAIRWKTESGKDNLERVLRDYPEFHLSRVNSLAITFSTMKFHLQTLKDVQAYISCITDRTAVTVTMPSREETSFLIRLTEVSLLAQSIGLRGRYHHGGNSKAVHQIKDLCSGDERFKFPHADRLILPLRSNTDAGLITNGALHDLALDSILTEQSQWFETVKATVAASGGKNVDVISVGTESFLPRSVTSELHLRPMLPTCVDGVATDASCLPNGTDLGSSGLSHAMHGELDLPVQSSFYPTPCTESDQDAADVPSDTSAVAVVGMACRFPEADSLEDFWRLIASGVNAVRTIPRERFNVEQLWRDPKGPFWGNFLRNPEAFDHRFFSVSGREAKSMDPQQRLLLQVVYEAMESSGYYGLQRSTQPNNIGCYVGVGSVDYDDNVSSENATAFSALGTLRAFISGRVSHYFGWSGPSITYDTACSSSAVAIHSACKAILSGECSMAVAGGVNVITSPRLFQNLSAGGFLNPAGASKAFDADANGYCRGEGAGVVVLKPLHRAVAECDSILGVIAGSAVNQGSNCTPITVPVAQSQSALYRQALSTASIEPEQVSYVEAHGTGKPRTGCFKPYADAVPVGTPVGDPIEYESIRQTFGVPSRNQQLFVGSVKDNIGHAEAASGAAGVIKTLLMMQNHTIPRQANFVSLNPAISPLEADRINIPKQTQPWDASKRSAVINNYGAAGSNVAIVLQEQYAAIDNGLAGAYETSSPHYACDFPFTIMAKSSESLRAYCAALKSFVTRVQETHRGNLLADVAYNLAKKQNRVLEHSLNFTAGSITALNDQLEASASGSDGLSKASCYAWPVVLCFGGQNGRKVHLSEDLFHSSRILQIHLVQCDSVCKGLGLPSIVPSIFQAEPVEDIVELHCRLFSVQYACAKSWIDCGLKVDTLIGHSFGQLTALCVAGSLSLEDGLLLISTRARLIQNQWGSEPGTMVAVEGDCQKVKDLLDLARKHDTSCAAEISCHNGPRSFVLAGDRASIKVIEDTVTYEDLGSSLKLQRLQNTHAFHSRLVDSILPGLEKVAESIQFQAPTIHVETCSPGQNWLKVDAGEVTRHSRMPVYFADAVERIRRRLKSCIWLEAGSGSPIIAMARRVLQADTSQHILLPVELGSPDAQTNLAKASSELWVAGSEVQFWPFHQSQRGSYAWLNLPPYQFEKTRHWLEYKQTINDKLHVATSPTHQKPELLQKLDGDNVQSLFSIDPTHSTFDLCTRGHAVLNYSLCPASMYFELAVRAASVAAGTTSSNRVPHIQELEISSPLSLCPGGSVFLRLVKDKTPGEAWKFSFFSRSQPDATEVTTHASGIVSLHAHDAAETTGEFQSLKRLVGNPRCEPIVNAPTANGLNGAIVYKNFGRVVDYAAYYRGVKRVFAKDLEAVGHVSVPEEQPPELESGCCDPVAIDNFLQVSGIHINCLWDCKDDEVFVCTAIRDLSFSEDFLNKPNEKRSWTVYSNSEPKPKGQVVNDIFVLDSETGELVLTLLGAKFTSLPLKSLSKTLSKVNGFQRQDLLHQNTERNDASPLLQYRYQQPDDAQTLVSQDDSETSDNASSTDDGSPDQDQILEKLQEMLSEVIEVSIDDIRPDSALGDLGIDSLMTSEVISEIKSRFGVEIFNTEFQELADIRSLCGRIQPSAPESKFKKPRRPQDTPKQEDIASSYGTQTSSKQDLVGSLNRPSMAIALSAKDCFKSAKDAFDAAAITTGFNGFSRDIYPMQKELVVAYVVEAFTALGCPLASLRPGQQLPEIRYSSKHTKVMSQYYNILEDANLVTRTERGICRTSVVVPQQPAQSLYSTIVEQYPQHVSEHRLLNTTGPKLANCLAERDDPIALLFGSATARALMTDVYTNAPMFKAGTQVLAQYLSDVFHESNSDHEIRILELGAGTGGTTSYLIESLAQCRQKFRYTFTDLSSSLVVAAKKKFAQHDFMEYATLDIEQEPPAQHLGRYDIIISTNCIHATKNLTASTTNIRKMLQPEGLLCLVELTRNLFWFDLVFGLLEGWWLFNDGRKHALASEGLWEHDLHRAGFRWVDWTESDSQESEILRVIVASPSKMSSSESQASPKCVTDCLEMQETVAFKQDDDTQLLADIYYPEKPDGANTIRPVGEVA
ncbi:MAG: hypothetical protein Q9225_002883 [Loekoesia sp. 1 TL-2023]